MEELLNQAKNYLFCCPKCGYKALFENAWDTSFKCPYDESNLEYKEQDTTLLEKAYARLS